MKRGKTYKVKELAALSGVSVRTLHHYDKIGLLVPSRSGKGYRLYTDDDLFRLQQILIQRELGLPLEEIRKGLDDPKFDARTALLKQRKLLQEKAHTTAKMLVAVDQAIAHLAKKEKSMTDLKNIFEGFDPGRYEAEAKARWGKTDAYKESFARLKNYPPGIWEEYKAEQKAIFEDAARLMAAGKQPSGKDAMDVAERHRLMINRFFYTCGKDMHCGLAGLYEADTRFAENIDKYGKGLTPFFAAAIRANAKRA